MKIFYTLKYLSVWFWVWVVSKNRSLIWFGPKFFILGLVRLGLHFENLVRFGSQNSELVATLVYSSRHNGKEKSYPKWRKIQINFIVFISGRLERSTLDPHRKHSRLSEASNQKKIKSRSFKDFD